MRVHQELNKFEFLTLIANMTNEIIYRKISASEIDLYHHIRLDCLKNYPDNFGVLYEEEVKANNFKFDKIIADKNATDFLMSAFSDADLIGTCGFIQEIRKKKNHIGVISGMYVMPAYKSKGIGKQLIQATISKAFENPEIEMITLAVAGSNTIAQNLYNKIGFKEYGRLPNYFKYKGEYETQVFMALSKQPDTNE